MYLYTLAITLALSKLRIGRQQFLHLVNSSFAQTLFLSLFLTVITNKSGTLTNLNSKGARHISVI